MTPFKSYRHQHITSQKTQGNKWLSAPQWAEQCFQRGCSSAGTTLRDSSITNLPKHTICINIPSTPAFQFCLERWSNASQIKRYIGKSSMRVKNWGVQHRIQDIRGSLGITALYFHWMCSPSPAFHWSRMPLLPHTPVTSHKTQEMAQTQRHRTTKDQLIS